MKCVLTTGGTRGYRTFININMAPSYIYLDTGNRRKTIYPKHEMIMIVIFCEPHILCNMSLIGLSHSVYAVF